MCLQWMFLEVGIPDTEIVTITGILGNSDHTIGRAVIYLGIGELGKTASVKMYKMQDAAMMHPYKQSWPKSMAVPNKLINEPF